MIGILGGGLSGISLQYLLKKDNEIVEKEERIGGLCRTYEKGGFYYDIGGHILFSKNEKIVNFIKTVLGENSNYCRRNNQILYKDRFIKYPFENGLGALDKEEIYDCLIGYLQNSSPPPANLLMWIYHTFGRGIAEKYLVPYNQKIWKTDLSQMSMAWVERIPRPPVEDIIKSALGIETEGYTHQLYFSYPAHGGIEGLIAALRKNDARIRTHFQIQSIKRAGNEWLVSDGNTVHYYDKIIVTLPIKEAVNLLENVPENIRRAAAALMHNSVRVVLVGVNTTVLENRTAMYVPDPAIIAHRICYMNSFSKSNSPCGQSSLMAEITTHPGLESHTMADALLIEKVVNDVHQLGLLDKKDVVVTDIQNHDYGYVVYDLDHQKHMRLIRSYFEEIGIQLHGRFAEFEYLNMDEVMRRSAMLADKLNKEDG
jgi:protoporphyrinogen oxidase